MSKRLDAAGDPELRRALVLARSQAEPLSADDAAAALGIHRNVARARLDRLVSAGSRRASSERRSARRGRGAGRPAKLYEVAVETESVEFPERQFSELARLLVDRLDDPALRAAGIDYGGVLARRSALRPDADLRRALERLCQRLGASGFQVALVDVSPGEATLTCPTCPLRPIVLRSDRAAVLDRGMWSGLLAAAVEGVDVAAVECSTDGCSDDHSTCRIVLRIEP